MLVRTTSGSRRQGPRAICLDFACNTVLESAAEEEQARVLERVQ